MKARTKKAKQGQRHREALRAIARFTLERRDWSHAELAEAMKINVSQARTLLATLIVRGHLAPREVQVLKLLPVVTDTGRSALGA